MINVKYRVLNKNEREKIWNKIKELLFTNIQREKVYFNGNDICLYKIDDFVIDNGKIFTITFYAEKTKYYDFNQNFLSKLIFLEEEINYIMAKVGYVFITDLFVKSFGFFWKDTFGKIFAESSTELVYKNF